MDYPFGGTSGCKIDENPLFGLFTETELTGMLQPSDYIAVDKVPAFLEAIVDELCGLDGNASITS